MNNIYIYIFVMALTTYLIRMLPLALFKKEITNKFIKSFLYYVPYACLACMTFPSFVLSTEHIVSGVIGLAVSFYMAYKEKSLLAVSLSACASVFIAERLLEFIGVL